MLSESSGLRIGIIPLCSRLIFFELSFSIKVSLSFKQQLDPSWSSPSWTFVCRQQLAPNRLALA